MAMWWSSAEESCTKYFASWGLIVAERRVPESGLGRALPDEHLVVVKDGRVCACVFGGTFAAQLGGLKP